MKITKIETISLAEFPNVIWIQVYTDAGQVGLGETFFGSRAVHAYVHETLASQMLGQDALRIEQHSRKLLQGWYRELADDLPPLSGGFIAPTEAPGLGIKLKHGLTDRPDATIKVSAL